MIGYFAVLAFAAAVFWLDPLLNALAPSLAPEAPVLPRTPRPPINESLLALEDEIVTCPPDAYTVHILSKTPLVLYVENFVSLAERQHLIAVSNPLYETATVTDDGGRSVRRSTVRESEVAIVPRDNVVRCIEARARSLQGWRDELWIERLRVQRYMAPSGHYGFHYDWSRPGAATGGWGRVSSIMVFVDDGTLNDPTTDSGPLVGGGTYFPRMSRHSTDTRWCRFIGCGDDAQVPADEEDDAEHVAVRNNATTGVVFQPVPGHAVLWENFRPDGTGRPYDETWHAGLRVQEGVKVGLNIWSWGRMD